MTAFISVCVCESAGVSERGCDRVGCVYLWVTEFIYSV